MNILGKYTVPGDTRVVLHQSCVLMDEKHWQNAHEFRPERFLDAEGKYLKVKPAAFIPFSTGRRICPGEQLAINDLFLAITRLLQLTDHYTIELDHKYCSPDYLEADPTNLWMQFPKPFELILKQK